MIKVALTGSESTGKTELAGVLGARFAAPVSHEYVREFAAMKAERGSTHIDFADHGPIARGQMAAEDAAIAKAGDIVILDTDLVSTVVYCRHYFQRAPAWIVEEARRRAADLYLLMRPDIPWIADGVRDRAERREEMHALFRSQLRDFALAFVEIGGDWDQRVQDATAAVTRLLADRSRRAPR
jgi:NadR type nicotinamide-nucleotide adenylyltransferase